MYSYIHIPFCESKCKYCRFASIGDTAKAKINYYTRFLINEIKISDIPKNKLRSIYFWWGTPSTLNISQVGGVISSLKAKFGFKDNIEISLEATPSSITDEFISGVLESWVNRVSMWVQTLNPESLKEIWREDKNDIIHALDILSQYKNKYLHMSISVRFHNRPSVRTKVRTFMRYSIYFRKIFMHYSYICIYVRRILWTIY